MAWYKLDKPTDNCPNGYTKKYGQDGVGYCVKNASGIQSAFSVKVNADGIQNTFKVYAQNAAQAQQYAINQAAPSSPRSVKVVSATKLADSCPTSGSFSVMVNGINTPVFAPTLAAAKIIAAKQAAASKFASAVVGTAADFNPCATNSFVSKGPFNINS